MPTQVTEQFKKYCTTCGVLKWFHEFHKDESKEGGLRDQCKKCRQAHIDKSLVERANAEHTRMVAEQQVKGHQILETLADAGGKCDPHISELHETILSAFGGEAGYAKWLFADFLAARPGSASRVKFHQMIVSMTTKVSELGLAEQKLEMANTIDLMKIIQEAAGPDAPKILEGAIKEQTKKLDKPAHATASA